MSNIKMSDAFVLPVSSNNGDLFNSKNPIGDTRICKFYNMNQFKASKAAAHAINSHDSLVEQNQMLREALEVLREATEHLVDDSLVLFMRDGRKLNLDMVYDLVDTALETEM